MTLQSGQPVSQMQYVRHLLGANCCQGWWHGKIELQCLELSRRQIIHMFHFQFMDPLSSFSVGYKGESNDANDSKKEDLSQLFGI